MCITAMSLYPLLKIHELLTCGQAININNTCDPWHNLRYNIRRVQNGY